MSISSGSDDYTDYAASPAQALARTQRFYEVDPFPEIPAALLSSAEIDDYIRYTAMIYEYRPLHLKSASYAIPALGTQIIWEADGRRTNIDLVDDHECIFPANSISFINLKDKISLPNYIAARFNLTITHVHRGLLLGTGPLIDPGFEGRLLIPIHNLTDEEYRTPAKEPLIWMEFTKTSYTASKPPFPRQGRFSPFPVEKKNRSADEYLVRANNGNPIRSSIPQAIKKAEEDTKRALETAEDAAREAKAAEKTANRFFYSNITAGVLGLAALVYGLYQIYLQVNSVVQDSYTLSSSVSSSITPIYGDVKVLGADLKAALEKVLSLEKRLQDSEQEEAAKLRAISDAWAKQDSEMRERLRILQEQIEGIKSRELSSPRR